MDFLTYFPSFGGLLFTLAAFVTALIIIIAVHEYGHYIVGRWSGIHAEVFSLGFGPVIWSGVDKRGTKWQLAAIPVGGYVKFLGDSSAASGKDTEAIENMDRDKRRHTMHEAPLWARAATVAAGPIFNFILSIIVFAAVIAWRGIATDPLTIDELRAVPFTQELQPGDEIVSIAGVPMPPIAEMEGYIDMLPKDRELEYAVIRDDRELTVLAPHPRPALIQSLTPQSAAMDADLKVGDVILGVDGQPINVFSDLRDYVGESDGRELTFEIWREGDTFDLSLTPRRMDLPKQEGGFETRWLIGISGGLMFEPATETPGIWESITYGADQTWFIITSSISGLYHVIVGTISTCNLRGPVGIAETSGEAASQGAMTFIWFIAVLSTAVGFLNLLPIPILDGGHLLFHTYEAIFRRPPSDGALRALMGAGLFVLITFMVFALSNDFLCP